MVPKNLTLNPRVKTRYRRKKRMMKRTRRRWMRKKRRRQVRMVSWKGLLVVGMI